MKVRVNLYGTLSRRVPGYRHSQGLEIEIPDGATVKDLLAFMEISKSQRVVVVREGRVLKGDDKIQKGIPVNIFQAIHGG